MTERVTLKPGDYVAMCDIIDQSQYEKIGESFVAAGCRSQHWEEHSKEDFGQYNAVGWDSEDDVLCTDNPQHDNDMPSNVRRLTPSQVLTATNVGGQTQDTLTTILESAADHDAKAKHHAAENERLMQQARDMLPDGWRLVRAEDMVQAVTENPRGWIKGGIEDMDDPYEWEEWEGGECPVEEGTLVDVRYRCGKEELALEAGRYNQGRESKMVAVDWSHSGNKNDIVAYRVCPT